MPPVHCTVLYFARAKDLVGVGNEEVEVIVAGGRLPTTDDVLRRVISLHPGLAELFSSEQGQGKSAGQGFVLALNQEYVEEPIEVQEGDELAIIPPISGG